MLRHIVDRWRFVVKVVAVSIAIALIDVHQELERADDERRLIGGMGGFMVYSFGGGYFPGEEDGVPRYDREISEPPRFDHRKIKFANFSETMGPDIGPVGEAFASGFRVSTTYMPIKVRYDDARPPLDIDQFQALMFVSRRARDIIERFEPNMHQFEDVDYVRTNGEHVADMFVLFICQRLDTVDRKHTNMVLSPYRWTSVKQMLRRKPELVPADADPDAPSRLVFNAQQIGGAHLWHDKHIDQRRFASDKLVDAIRGANLTGFGGGSQEVIA